MPIRFILALSLIALASTVRADDRPASALHVENHRELELPQILHRWRTGSRLGDRPGSLSFRRFVKDPASPPRMPSTFRFDWDGRGGVQFELEPEAVSEPDGAVSRTQREFQQDRHEVSVLSEQRILMVDLSRDEFEFLPAEEEPAVVRQRRHENWWNGLFLTDSDSWFHVMFANIPRILVGPGWRGTPENWVDRWDWIIRSQSERKISLLATPRTFADRDWVSEVTWTIERSTWRTMSVQVVDPREARVITWRRADDRLQPGAPQPLLTADRLEAAGFRNLSLSPEERETQSQRPADALVPRNRLVW